MKKVAFTVICNNGDGRRELLLPGKRVICSRCDGEGKHTNPAIDSHGITQEEFDENPGFQEAYMRGDYDVTCHECRGERVLSELNLDCLPKALRKRVEFTLNACESERAEIRHYQRLAAMGIEY